MGKKQSIFPQAKVTTNHDWYVPFLARRSIHSSILLCFLPSTPAAQKRILTTYLFVSYQYFWQRKSMWFSVNFSSFRLIPCFVWIYIPVMFLIISTGKYIFVCLFCFIVFFFNRFIFIKLSLDAMMIEDSHSEKR